MVAKSLAVAVVLVLASGCATPGTARRSLAEDWIDEARSTEGLVLAPPLRISPDSTC